MQNHSQTITYMLDKPNNAKREITKFCTFHLEIHIIRI